MATPSAAQLPPIFETTTTSAPTTTSSSTTTTTGVTTTTSGVFNPVTTTTEADRRDDDEPATTTSTLVPGGVQGPGDVPPPVTGGDGSPPVDQIGPRVIPDWAQEQMASIVRSSANNTSRVLELLAPLEGLGFSPQEVAMLGLGRFPIRGQASFIDDWWFPRFVPDFHLHQGTDVFADFGTPIVSPVDGVLTFGESPVGGRYSYVTTETDGTYYYFSHLDTLPEPPEETRITDPAEVARFAHRSYDHPGAYRVKVGDLIGTVGDSGNAKGGAPHAHVEVHPAGGEATNPKPILDAWLAEAEANVAQVLALYGSRGPKAVLTTQRTRATGGGQYSAPSRPLEAEMLGVSAAGPGAGVQVLTGQLSRSIARIDWERYEGARLDRPAVDLATALAAAFPSSPARRAAASHDHGAH